MSAAALRVLYRFSEGCTSGAVPILAQQAFGTGPAGVYTGLFLLGSGGLACLAQFLVSRSAYVLHASTMCCICCAVILSIMTTQAAHAGMVYVLLLLLGGAHASVGAQLEARLLLVGSDRDPVSRLSYGQNLGVSFVALGLGTLVGAKIGDHFGHPVDFLLAACCYVVFLGVLCAARPQPRSANEGSHEGLYRSYVVLVVFVFGVCLTVPLLDVGPGLRGSPPELPAGIWPLVLAATRAAFVSCDRWLLARVGPYRLLVLGVAVHCVRVAIDPYLPTAWARACADIPGGLVHPALWLSAAQYVRLLGARDPDYWRDGPQTMWLVSRYASAAAGYALAVLLFSCLTDHVVFGLGALYLVAGTALLHLFRDTFMMSVGDSVFPVSSVVYPHFTE